MMSESVMAIARKSLSPGCVVVALLTRNENFPAMMSESGCLMSPTTAAEIPLVDKIETH